LRIFDTSYQSTCSLDEALHNIYLTPDQSQEIHPDTPKSVELSPNLSQQIIRKIFSLCFKTFQHISSTFREIQRAVHHLILISPADTLLEHRPFHLRLTSADLIDGEAPRLYVNPLEIMLFSQCHLRIASADLAGGEAAPTDETQTPHHPLIVNSIYASHPRLSPTEKQASNSGDR
jgi:hypothetical protein